MAATRAASPGGLAGVRARFDDLTPDGVSVQLTEPVVELVARAPGEVREVLRAAEDAARRGNWVAGFVGYEAAAGLDPTLAVVERAADDPLAGLPLAWFAVFSRRELVSPVRWTGDASGPAPGTGHALAPASVDRPADRLDHRLDQRLDDGFDDRPGDGSLDRAADRHGDWSVEPDRDWHLGAVATIREAIARGDYYQLNLTARLTGSVEDPARLYAALATAQAGAYHALITTPDHTVISASPELFFSRTGNRLVVRPMKGTAARGRWAAEDLRAAGALRHSAKERAENTMIVDLLRNDLGRIALTGSVRVSELFAAERYPTVWQLTSTVTAEVPPSTDLVDVFTALFPSGSVTGAPKRAAMTAIAALEQRPRGVYCGAVGYLAPNPDDPDRPSARFNVAIRTITQALDTGYAEYGAGGAITYPSRADAEWAELLTKTAVLRRPARPDGLIETLRFTPPDLLVNLDRHLDRLSSSADYFGFRCDRGAVTAALATALAGRREPARVRISLARSGEVGVDVGDVPRVGDIAVVGPAGAPVRSDDVLLFHKHADRARYQRYRESQPWLDDVILWNERREVTETTIATIAVCLAGAWWTPPLRCGLLPGVQRARLLEEGTIRERVIHLDELPNAQGLALISSLRGWRPARLLTRQAGEATSSR